MQNVFDWKKTLTSGEKIEMEFGVSKKFATGVLVLTSVTGIAVTFSNIFIGIAIFILGVLYFIYLTKGKRFALTDKRIILIDSFFGREVVTVDYKQITDSEIEQSPFDMMCGWGSLSINTAGTHSPVIKLPFVNDPQKIKQKLDSLKS